MLPAQPIWSFLLTFNVPYNTVQKFHLYHTVLSLTCQFITSNLRARVCVCVCVCGGGGNRKPGWLSRYDDEAIDRTTGKIGVRVPAEREFSSRPQRPDQPSTAWIVSRLKRTGCEADHSLENARSRTSTSPYITVCCLIKGKYNFSWFQTFVVFWTLYAFFWVNSSYLSA